MSLTLSLAAVVSLPASVEAVLGPSSASDSLQSLGRLPMNDGLALVDFGLAWRFEEEGNFLPHALSGLKPDGVRSGARVSRGDLCRDGVIVGG
jgi:hypothetical protein